MKFKRLFWREPNRSQGAHLHIASRGQRLSTLTGVAWIDAYRFVVNHQVGLRVAIFDLRADHNPVLVAEVPHNSDAVAARKLTSNSWEIVVSGCWDAVFSTYHLMDDEQSKFYLVKTRRSNDKSFSHGVSFGQNDVCCLAYHTGQRPRIQIGDKSWQLPAPWGPRDVCYDVISDRYFAVAVSHSASMTSYKTASTSLWYLDIDEDKWKILQKFNELHADSCQVHNGLLWFPDQLGDRVLAFDLKLHKRSIILKSECFDFPHGLAISPAGVISASRLKR
jgi:hypothetical protein